MKGESYKNVQKSRTLQVPSASLSKWITRVQIIHTALKTFYMNELLHFEICFEELSSTLFALSWENHQEIGAWFSVNKTWNTLSVWTAKHIFSATASNIFLLQERVANKIWQDQLIYTGKWLCTPRLWHINKVHPGIEEKSPGHHQTITQI